MMKQYQDAKRACPDALLLFRMGDFYEMFYEDAKTAARTLNLALTSRDKGENGIPMAGFPYHQLETYLGKLIQAGLRAAVCDQVEDPKKATGLVRREVTRVVTPGTLTEEALLDPHESNYLAAVAPGDPVGLAWVELSTGRFVAASFPLGQLADQLARIAPSECLLAEDAEPLAAHLNERMMVTRRPAWAYVPATACESLAKHFGTANLEGFGFEVSANQADVQAVRAAGAILDYLSETQKSSLAHLDRLVPYRAGDTLEIDEASRRSLEITRTLREGRREGSLLAVLDRTVTAMGSRLLSDWVANPLLDLAAIQDRLDAVGELVAEPALTADLRDMLRRVYDVERLLARVTTGRATPRDLSFLGRTLRGLPAVKAKLTARKSRLLNGLEAGIDLCPELRAKLEAALVDDCPLSARDGGLIRDRFHAELDSLRELAHGGKQWIARYQADETQRTGIPSLKVGFNKVFGYYLEVTNTHGARVPDHYIRKQTIKNAERYITPELKEYESLVLNAEAQIHEVELRVYKQVCAQLASSSSELLNAARAIASLDCLLSFGSVAALNKYTRPRLNAEKGLKITAGRHPVVERMRSETRYIPNDVLFEDGEIVRLITGPNMSGKSTYLRQVVLIVLMAQIGSFVPADEAKIGLVDRVFTRIGAQDAIHQGQSTFMVEMLETANILNNASSRSLVILDEIGRGTSTYDGLSIAWAIVEHLHTHPKLKPQTLFATHYHELTELAELYPGVRNYNVAVTEADGTVVFLHKIVPGAADRSYGIHVAQMAGLPSSVITRANEILKQLEQSSGTTLPDASATQDQMRLFPENNPMIEAYKKLDLETISPIQALNLLYEWKRKYFSKEE